MHLALRGAAGWSGPLAIDGNRATGHGLERSAVVRHPAAPWSAGKPVSAATQQVEYKAQDQQGPDEFQDVFHDRKKVE
jgi:hypothetical protein